MLTSSVIHGITMENKNTTLKAGKALHMILPANICKTFNATIRDKNDEKPITYQIENSLGLCVKRRMQ